ncbi:SRPBCC family protein [Rhodococcus sp. ZPP]|uniref:SRPBCC family protein n=1 Tax=Rhodococcus sp. ZPP TaxID=2749906 RepID=UPI001AD87EAD|nr:SRPBCC family protein [Rhodococcus sp. ZPP]QTJ69060.1 SRPBCC family protein [Rhodococcus sp. ZPP]
MAAVDVETQATIARPRHEVAAYASNPGNATAWYANITEVKGDCGGPVETGAEFAFVAEFLGRRLVYTYEVVEHVPGTRLVMRTAEGPFPMETIYEWEDVADGKTRMTLRNRGEPSGFARIGAPVLSRAMRRANNKDLARLKGILEAEPGNS